MDFFDYVVVGAGTAGCVLANRLSAQGLSVCVLEAGPRDRNPLIHIPAGYIRNIYSKTLTWGFEAEPGPGVNNRKFALPQGRVLGGSSSINGLNYVRGQALDYDDWSAAGNPGWSFEEVLPYFKRSESWLGEASEYRGRDGALPISELDWHHPLSEALVEAAVSCGIPRVHDYNTGHQEGVGYFQRTIYKGLRYSSAKAFLRSAEKMSHVEVRTHSQATAIIFDGKRAVGVRYVKGAPGGQINEVRARREVLVAAGAINTPKLLQVSGVGPHKVLNDIGVPVVHVLEGVGQNLRDHYAVRMVSRIRGVKTINQMVRGPALLKEIGKWILRRPSLLAVSPSLVHLFCKSNPGLDRPDLEFACSPASFRKGVVGLLDVHPGMTLGVWQERPESLGYVRARSRDAFDKPIIQPNYLTHTTDQQVLLAGMRLARELFRTSAMSRFVDVELSPPPQLETDDELLDFAREMGTTVYHMIGTARMGPVSDTMNVVDAQLRIHGLQSIRVVDASIMPSMPSANTNATTYMIAEKASDMILKNLAGI